MIKIFRIISCTILFGFLMQSVKAQVPDDTDGWLFRLCKTWGYVKYFNQHKCGIPWDQMLRETIIEVLDAKNNADFNSALLGFLNQAGNNLAVSDPPAKPDINLNFHEEWIRDPVFSQPVRNFLDTFSKHLYPDRTDCLVKSATTTLIDFSNDRITQFIDYTKESDRLTVMFYYWNIINYFSPYISIMDQPWDSTLRESIPAIREAANSIGFQKSLLKLTAHINDTHAATGSIVFQNPLWGGDYVPGISFVRAEGQTVVRKLKNITDVKVGDVLTHINGIPVETIADSLSEYVPASTPAAFYRDMYTHMLRGPGNSFVGLTLTDASGESYTVSEKRTFGYGNPVDVVSPETYFITSCGYGYVNMGKLIPSQVPTMYNTLKNTAAIIFDIRNYPAGTMGEIAKFLLKGPVTSAIYFSPAIVGPFTGSTYLPGWFYQSDDFNNFGTWSTDDPYQGRVILLVNELTQSHAEYTCQYLSYHPNASVIGTQTAGADGNVATIAFPGGFNAKFTALGWYYADGYQQQRNGVKIDSVVAPTIQGIREGKDEILLAALDCISGNPQTISRSFDIILYPNPTFTGTVQVSLKNSQNSDITLSLMDLTGRILRAETRFCYAGEQTLTFNLKDITPGLYLLDTRDQVSAIKTLLVVR